MRSSGDVEGFWQTSRVREGLILDSKLRRAVCYQTLRYMNLRKIEFEVSRITSELLPLVAFTEHYNTGALHISMISLNSQNNSVNKRGTCGTHSEFPL